MRVFQTYIAIFFLILFGCQSTSNKNLIDLDLRLSDSINELTLINTKLEVSDIIILIDSLYEIRGNYKLELIESDKIRDKFKMFGPENFDTKNLISHKKYFSFQFLTYKNPASAKSQFEYLIDLSKSEQTNLTYKNPFWRIFEKSRSTYILFEDKIIYHKRRCNFNESIEKPREKALTELIFNSKFPSDSYFIRMKCWWTRLEVF